jgi:hypothetical protein
MNSIAAQWPLIVLAWAAGSGLAALGLMAFGRSSR